MAFWYSKVEMLATFSVLVFLFPLIKCWGTDGHLTVCRIAQNYHVLIEYTRNKHASVRGYYENEPFQTWFILVFVPELVQLVEYEFVLGQSRLSEPAADAVKQLLPEYANNDLGSMCSWADHVKFRYHWSSALHYIDTPDSLCTYQYNRDCKDENGEKDRCVAGAVNNYTAQLLTFSKDPSQSEYNLTEALLFLSHFMGDIHQPLHVGFTSDRGGNTINVHWYTRKQVLHHVWDDNIIETAEEQFYDSNVDDLIDAIQQNITSDWSDLVPRWETCSLNKTTCPDIYASEGIKAACDWAYKGVSEGSTLGNAYFKSRLPVVNLRLAQGGVRLAATLNRIFL